MQKNFTSETRRKFLFCFVILGLIAAFIAVPYTFRSEAGKETQDESKASKKTVSQEKDLKNYDIRTDKRAFEKIAEFRLASRKNAAEVADLRQKFVEAEADLRTKVPTLKVEYNPELRTPEVIAPETNLGRAVLTESANGPRAEILRGFVKRYESLVGVSDRQADELKVAADYTNPDGNLSFAHLKQFINGVPVFRGEVKAGFTKSGEMIRIINNLAPALNYSAVSTDFRNPADAVKAAAKYINHELKESDLRTSESVSNDLRVKFGAGGDWDVSAEKMYFPLEPGVARPAWRVLIWQPVNAYYVIVDAETGTMFWRKNITEDQTQAATFNVYANPNAMVNVADNPFPKTPGPLTPTEGAQGAAIGRTLITRTGNEAPYAFNNKGWIADGANTTDGNAVEAGLDRETPTGVDPNGKPSGNPFRSFNFAFNPGIPSNPILDGGDSPLPSGATPTPCLGTNTAPAMTEFQKASVTQLFYITNWYHDEMYRLGFTEAAGNFQHENFGRGGSGGDRISAEAQDCSGVNNANFGTPSDGLRGRMQMYLWTAPTPDFDGDLDADIVIHEITHGLSNRLHGDATGLSSAMARGMGEGWSDFYGHAMLSEPSDPIHGIYSTGSYGTYRLSRVGTSNYFYGIRRFPKAVMSFTGGPNNRPFNPLTFADIDSTQMNLNDGAFPPAFTGSPDQTHNAGEIWSSALWEVRAKFIQRLGWAVGNRRALQYVTDGMKLAPLSPTFLQERDAIIAAAQASLPAPQASDDVADIWEGFRIRGMGFSAKVLNVGSGEGDTRVTEAFDMPNLQQASAITVSDASGDGDGAAEPGENVTITVPLLNNTGRDAIGVTLQIGTGEAVNYGTIANSSSGSQTIKFTIPAASACGSTVTVTLNVDSSLGATSFTHHIILGVPTPTLTENFDTVTVPALPAGWTADSISGGVNFVTTKANPDTPENSIFALDPTTHGGGTDLTSPSIPITAPGATVSFRNRYHTESGWDGGVLEISTAGGAFKDILAAGGRFIEGGYNAALGESTNNPLNNRQAWTGDSGGYITTTAQLPAAAAGKEVKLRWRFGADDNTAEVGWNIDTIKVYGSYACSFAAPSLKSRADFDGDGKTDLSVFRPGDGNWYLQRSKDGFTAIKWGLPDDVLTPGDYDGDGKADQAVFRGGTWYILKSSDYALMALTFGFATDITVPADYDGDGKTDAAVYRPSTKTWYILKSSGGTQYFVFGDTNDKPVTGDFDGDGKADITVFRSGQWITQKSSGGVSYTSFGLPDDKLVPADYDGDGKDDVAVYRPSNGVWYMLRSSNGGVDAVQFGMTQDLPVPGDYDGDGKDDQAVFRAGVFYLNRSSSGFTGSPFGFATDKPVANALVY
jgi:hypothetical protein